MRRGFEAGRMKDEHIAALVEYAVVGSKSKPREALRWGCRYRSFLRRYGPGLKGVSTVCTPGGTQSWLTSTDW